MTNMTRLSMGKHTEEELHRSSGLVPKVRKNLRCSVLLFIEHLFTCQASCQLLCVHCTLGVILLFPFYT